MKLPDKLIPLWETVKMPLRWLVLYIASWIIESTLAQVNIIPESLDIKLWIFIYQVPLRIIFTITLKVIDTYIHEVGKENKNKSLTLGLTRF